MSLSQQSNISIGQQGEQIAADLLTDKGFQLIERNFCCKMGEIDLIATIEEYLVFIEVKTRRESKLGINPLLSITQAKQRKLKKLGTFYIAKNSIYNRQPRFDVIGIVMKSGNHHKIEHLENAF